MKGEGVKNEGVKQEGASEIMCTVSWACSPNYTHKSEWQHEYVLTVLVVGIPKVMWTPSFVLVFGPSLIVSDHAQNLLRRKCQAREEERG